MDLFVDLNKDIEERTFVAKCDLNADFLGRYSRSKKELKVTYIALESILNKSNLKNHLIDNNVEVISIPDSEIKDILNFHNTTVEMMVSGVASDEVKIYFNDYLQRKFKGIKPDFVIYWEYCSDLIYALYENSIFLEGSHTGFWRLEQNSDILFNVTTKNYKYKDAFFDSIDRLELTEQDKTELMGFRESFKENVLFETQINRSFLDPENKFKHLIFYAGNFPSLRFKNYSGFTTNSAFLQYLLSVLPEDCAIVYSKHSFDQAKEDHYISHHPRIIDLTNIASIDPDASMRVLPYVDAIINVYSNIFMPAMLVGTPVFSYGQSPNARFAIGDMSDLSEWLKKGQFITEKYNQLCDKILKYVITHKVNTRFLRNSRNSYLYLKKIQEKIVNGDEYINYLPELSTIRGYKERFSQGILVRNTVSISYEQTQFEIMMGYLLNDKIKNIGFDIFDTLLYRPLIKPTDLFDLMEEDVYHLTKLHSFNFSKTRVAAENLARYGQVETTLNDIYAELQKTAGFSDEVIEEIKSIECSLENQLLFARETLLEYFTLAKNNNKNLFIASDMYLPTDFLKRVLNDKGYDLANVSVYISAEHKKVKHNGTLFKHILYEEQIKPEETVFVGDNIKSDVQRATDAGLIAVHYPRAIEKLKNSMLFDRNVLGSVINDNYSFHLGLIANKIFDNPFIPFDKKTAINNSSALLGYYIFGPLVLSLTDWLINKSKNNNFEKILFSSRDSRIVFDVYNHINKNIYQSSLPESEYIYLSRTSTLPAYSDKARRMTLLSLYNSKHDVKNYLGYLFDIDLDKNKNAQVLAKKLGLKLHEDSSKNLPKISLFLQEYYDLYEDIEVLKTETVKRYFENIISSKKIAMFDLGARGTSRDVLSDLLGIDIPLYLFRKTRYKCNNDIEGYLTDTQNTYRHGVRVILPLFYELLLSDALVSTCHGYQIVGENVEPIIEPTEFTRSSLLTLNSQNFMKKFCKDYSSVFKGKLKYINSQTRDIFVFPLSYLCSHSVDIPLLKQYYGEDPLWKDEKLAIIFPPIKKSLQNNVNSPVVEKANKSVPHAVVQTQQENLTRRTYIYFKRRFYKYENTKKIWDGGRNTYLKIFSKK